MKAVLFIALFALVAVATAWPWDCNLELGKEYPPANEPAAVASIKKTVEGTLRMEAAAGLAMRFFHSKAHGCVNAKFQVADSVPSEYRHGVFATPGKEYDAFIRFSNGLTVPGPDLKPDTRGFALKLLNVAGDRLENDGLDVQDFIGAAFKKFFFHDAFTLSEGMIAFQGGLAEKAWFLAKHPITAASIVAMGVEGLKVKNPLNGQYFSQTPYRLGPDQSQAVKLMYKPCSPVHITGEGDNYLRVALNNQLNVNKVEGCFDVYVQKQEDACDEPIEDSMVEWETDFTRIGRITVPTNQDIDSDEAVRNCENSQFNIWHGLKDHQPLGINRVRQPVYKFDSELRHSLNNVEVFHPDL